MNKDMILARLQNGEDAEAIANELINMLNAANMEYVAIQEKEAAEAEAKKAAAAREAELNALAQNMVDAVADYIRVAYPDAQIDITGEVSIGDVREMIDGIYEFSAALKDLDKLFGERTFKHRPAMFEKVEAAPKKKTQEQILAEFLKANGLA